MSVQETKLAAIADAIRDRDGTTAPIPADDFPERIRAIPGGIELQSIAITAPPARTSYLAGEAFDPTGMVVTAAYSNGATLAATGYAVEPSGPLTDGVEAVTVRYTEGGRSATATQPITVIHRLLSISIETPPAKTEYQAGEVFDPAGMAVLAAYSDGGSAAVTGYTVPTEAFAVPGPQTVAVTYTENGVTASASVSVTVARLVIETVPSQSGSPTYTGEAITLELENYDPAQLTLGGTTSAVNAGEYAATVTPTESWQWSDGTTGAKPVVWTIGKAAGSVTIPQNSVTLDASTPMVTLPIDWEGDGTMSAVSSDTSVAIVEVVDGGVGSGQVLIYAVANTSGTATVTVTISEGSNHLEVSGTVAVTASFVQIYGAEWDGTATTKLTRTDAAALFTDPVPAVNNGTGSSPFDNIMPWAGMKRVTDSQAGELVEIPKFWYKLTQNGNGIRIQISAAPVAGFNVSPAHIDRGDGKGEREAVYVGRYHCANTYKSTTNVKPYTGKTVSEFRTGIHNLGENIWSIDFLTVWTIQLLYLVEFASWDSQGCIGYGGGNGRSTGNMGYTDAMRYHTGTSLSSRTTYGLGTQYRWIEGLWDNVTDNIDFSAFPQMGNLAIRLKTNMGAAFNVTIPVDADYDSNYTGRVYALSLKVYEGSGISVIWPTQWTTSKQSTMIPDAVKGYSSSSFGGNYTHNGDYGLFYITMGSYGSSWGARLIKLPNPS